MFAQSYKHPITVGLVSHWPCITDSMVYPPLGSLANVWEMSTLPMPHAPCGVWHPLLFT